MSKKESYNKRSVLSWALFDWANSAFPTIIITFVFATFFTEGIVSNTVKGTALWGYTMSISALAVAILSPIMGAVADKSGPRKPWLMFFMLLTVFSCYMLWLTKPDTSWILWALIFAGLGNFAFEAGMVFYNSMLPDISPARMWGRVSGYAWGAGYCGGLVCLLIALIGFIQTETPWFGLEKADAENIRATTLLVGVWFLVFSIPLFIFTSDKTKSESTLTSNIFNGLKSLIITFKKAKKNIEILKYLIARMIYTDGLNTLFAFGGIYAAGSFGFTLSEIILFGIAINLTAGLGAALFASVDDVIGPKKTILTSLLALSILGICLVIVDSKTLFWAFGLALGIFVGPAQSASRSLMARLAPKESRAEMFGLYAFSGKATAFLGPAILGVVTDTLKSQRAGVATIIIFFVVGGIALYFIKEPVRSR